MKFPKLHIKKLDWFIIKSFLLSFAGTFFICTFIFIMQFLWRSIDDFVGKGLDMWVMAQFFYFGSLTMISQSLPLAILLAAIMTFGNFGERLELLAMKAAGISLIRIMAPLIVMSGILCCISFYFQNVISPKAQLKLYTIIFSIKQTSPEVEIPEGVFYDQLEGYNLFVKKKNKETGMLYRVMIYDMTQGFENASIIVSDSGKIETTADQEHMLLKLYSGERFANATELRRETKKKNIPYTREKFREKIIVIDFGGGFDMKDGSFLKSQAASKNILELQESIDSLSHYNDSIGHNNWRSAMRSAYPQTVAFNKEDSLDQEKDKIYVLDADSAFNNSAKLVQLRIKKAELDKIEQLRTDFEIKKNIMRSLDRDLNKHRITWWEKITISLSCLVFFFIGAPLGAVVRKGGLGYPVLISVATYILYYIFYTSGYKMARSGEWYVWFGCWISTLVLVPLGAIFTYQSNKDSAIFNKDAYKTFVMKLFGLRETRNIAQKEVIIEDPDYISDYEKLKFITYECHKYNEQFKSKKIPDIAEVFFNKKTEKPLYDLNERLESLIEELSNSKYRKIIQLLNEYPVMTVNGLYSPFNKRWLNISAIIIMPIGFVLYLRAYKFYKRLLQDLVKIENISSAIMERMQKENLV